MTKKLKCWKKKSGAGVIENLWEKKSKSSNFDNQEVWAYKVRDKGKVKWAVTLRDIGYGLNDSLHKNKVQAIKFANSYMENNDKC